jgi:hypothetical protein
MRTVGAKLILDRGSHGIGAGSAETIAQHEIDPRAPGIPVAMAGGGHRVAIQQQAAAVALPGLPDQPGQRAMIGDIAAVDPALRLGERQLGAVDFAVVGGETRDAAEAGGDPG